MSSPERPVTHKVLLVDDDHAIRDMMSVALERKGFDVVAAASVAEALKLITSESFDVLITDLGSGLLWKMQPKSEDRPDRRIGPVLISSGIALRKDNEQTRGKDEACYNGLHSELWTREQVDVKEENALDSNQQP
jgi:response regulator RpfG family c-di-GMP phosphodiesterase